MISFKKSKSHFLAAIGTFSILLLLFTLLNFQFSGEQSSKLSEFDDLMIQMEQNSFEDNQPTPSGKDPLTDKKDNSTESISKVEGIIKPQSLPEHSVSEIKEEPLLVADTIIKPKKEITLLKVDSIQKVPQDSVTITQILTNTKRSAKKDLSHEHEKYAYYQKNYVNVRNFKKVYPYALIIRQLVDNLNSQLKTMSNESEKRKLIKETEKMLFKQYESAVRTMTRTQGELLLKLISRETSKTGYQLIKDYRGSLPASFWYGIGKIFGTDLKTEFHKEKEDSIIEDILVKYNNADLY
jgi:hypothetical protein